MFITAIACVSNSQSVPSLWYALNRTHAICMTQSHAVQTLCISWTPCWDQLRSLSVVGFPKVLRWCALEDDSCRTVTHSDQVCISVALTFKLQPPPRPKHVRGVCVPVCVQWGVTIVQVHWSWVSVSCSTSVYVCLRPICTIVGDKASCPLRPHLHRHPSWCHLSWPRTKLSPWEKTACCAPCSESTRPCPAPTHACSASALFALITTSLPCLCTHKNMEQ